MHGFCFKSFSIGCIGYRVLICSQHIIIAIVELIAIQPRILLPSKTHPLKADVNGTHRGHNIAYSVPSTDSLPILGVFKENSAKVYGSSSGISMQEGYHLYFLKLFILCYSPASCIS